MAWLRYQLRLPELRQLLLDNVSGAAVDELLEVAGEAFPGLVEARLRGVRSRGPVPQPWWWSVPDAAWMAGRSSPGAPGGCVLLQQTACGLLLGHFEQSLSMHCTSNFAIDAEALFKRLSCHHVVLCGMVCTAGCQWPCRHWAS